MDSLQAISPIDGRYRRQVEALSEYFSEEALIRYRVRVEILYFIALSKEIPQLEGLEERISLEKLHNVYKNFTVEDALRIKEIESVTNHDVKAVEYFIKEQFDKLGLSREKEFIHFGLTSQDINNTSFPLMLKESIQILYLPLLDEVLAILNRLATEWADIPMLARTHGQAASPTRLGKEFKVFAYRLKQQREQLVQISHTAKFGGATGNFNAHKITYPSHDWLAFADDFVANSLGLEREQLTTQIANYDSTASLFDCLERINTILIDLARDVWTYVSMDYFKQKIKEGEVGSSAMPHKVNPIDFENAEGNLGLANAVFAFMSRKLPISRLQRDLTDSTVLRNIGVPLGHTCIALNSLKKGLNKLLINPEKIQLDLENNWVVVAEALQTILRREAYPQPYEALKALTRTNTKVTAESIAQFVDGLDISDELKAEMKAVTPMNYLGY